MSGNASVSGSGVMIVNAGSKYPTTGGTYGSIALGGNGSYNLSPLSTGAYAGIVIFQPGDNTNALSVSGNASGMTGAIYAPAAQLAESGNAQLDAALVVDTLTISGNGIADGAATLTSTIVAGQTAGSDISGAVSGSNNLIGISGSGALIDGVGGNIVGMASTNESVAAFDQTTPNTSGSTIPIKVKVTDALGNSVSSSSLPVVSMSVIGPDGNPVPQTARGTRSRATCSRSSRPRGPTSPT